MRAECQGQNPLPLLEEAHALAGGEFLEDDLYAEWAQGRRHTLDGARHRVLFKLVDLYLEDERVGLAEELLFAALEEDPTDEDALCRLMVLLVEQERRQEALQLYQYTEDVLREEQAEPAVYTRELARRIRQGLVLRERGERYTTVGDADAVPGGAGCGIQRACGRLRRERSSGGHHCCSRATAKRHPPTGTVNRAADPADRQRSLLCEPGVALAMKASITVEQAPFTILEQEHVKDYSGSAPGKAISRVCSSSDQSAGGLKAIAYGSACSGQVSSLGLLTT